MSEPMTPERIAAIQARVEAVVTTRQRYEDERRAAGYKVTNLTFMAMKAMDEAQATRDDHWTDDIAALLAEVARLKAEIEAWRKQAPMLGENSELEGDHE